MTFSGLVLSLAAIAAALAAIDSIAADNKTALSPALSAILHENNSYHRLRTLEAYADQLHPEDIPPLYKKIAPLHGPARDNLLQILAGRWIETDPPGALAAARTMTTDNSANYIFDAFYGDWAARDSGGAIAVLPKLPSGEQGEATWATIYQVADHNPVQAAELFKSIRFQNVGDANHDIYSQWAGKDLDQATTTLLEPGNFPERGARSYAIEGIADYLVATNSPEAANWLTRLPAGQLRDEARKRITQQWARLDPAAAIKWVQKLSDEDQNREALQAVLFQWADQDPFAALAYTLTLPEGGNKPFLMNECVVAATKADSPATLSWAKSLPTSTNKDEIIQTVIKTWSKVDPVKAAAALASTPKTQSLNPSPYSAYGRPAPSPQAAASFAPKSAQLAALLKEPNPYRELKGLLAFVDALTPNEFPLALDPLRLAPEPNRNEVLDLLVGRWMEIDPQGVVSALVQSRAIADTDFGRRFLTDVFDAWSARDQDAALAYALHSLAGQERRTALKSILPAIAQKNPARALELIHRQPGEYSTNETPADYLIPVFTAWAIHDLPSATHALLQYGEMEDGPRNSAIKGIIAGLVLKDPPSAASWLKQLSAERTHDAAFNNLVDLWAETDPAATMAWLKSLPPSKQTEEAQADMAIFWANHDAIETLKYGMALPDGKVKSSLLEYGLAQLTYNDAQAAAHWVESLPDAMKKNSFWTMIGWWSDYNPPAAASYVTAMPDGPYRQAAIQQVALGWSYHNPVAAAQWVAGFPDSPAKADAIAAIGERWANLNLAQATTWAKQFPPGINRDAASRGLSNGLARSNSTEAMKWAESISDPKIRHDQLITTLQLVMYRDMFPGGEASFAITHSSLPEADKKKLLDKLPKLQIYPYPAR